MTENSDSLRKVREAIRRLEGDARHVQALLHVAAETHVRLLQGPEGLRPLPEPSRIGTDLSRDLAMAIHCEIDAAICYNDSVKCLRNALGPLTEELRGKGQLICELLTAALDVVVGSEFDDLQRSLIIPRPEEFPSTAEASTTGVEQHSYEVAHGLIRAVGRLEGKLQAQCGLLGEAARLLDTNRAQAGEE